MNILILELEIDRIDQQIDRLVTFQKTLKLALKALADVAPAEYALEEKENNLNNNNV